MQFPTNRATRGTLSLLFVACFTILGCCGTNFTAVQEAKPWVAHDLAPGTKVGQASGVLKSKEFVVIGVNSRPHELVARKRLRVCIFICFPMWEELLIKCDLDDSDQIIKDSVELETAPGL